MQTPDTNLSKSGRLTSGSLFCSTLGLATVFIFLLFSHVQPTLLEGTLPGTVRLGLEALDQPLGIGIAPAQESRSEKSPASPAGAGPASSTFNIQSPAFELISPFSLRREVSRFEDPAAEQLLLLLEEAKIPKSEQWTKFERTYDQLKQYHAYDDFIATQRLKTRTAFERIGATGGPRMSPILLKDYRLHYTLHQQLIEERARGEQSQVFSNVVATLSLESHPHADALKQRLREIHPILPLGDRLSPTSGSATALGKTP